MSEGHVHLNIWKMEIPTCQKIVICWYRLKLRKLHRFSNFCVKDYTLSSDGSGAKHTWWRTTKEQKKKILCVWCVLCRVCTHSAVKGGLTSDRGQRTDTVTQITLLTECGVLKFTVSEFVHVETKSLLRLSGWQPTSKSAVVLRSLSVLWGYLLHWN